jgi:hypothetical protein
MRQAFIWDHLLKKRARGIDDCHLGHVQEVKADLIITKKGVLDKKRYYLTQAV